jgi:hypothetical protein
VSAPVLSPPATGVHAARVEAGIALLDAKLGRDIWLPRINEKTVEVASSDRCVLCQATGTTWYSEAVRAFDVDLAGVFDDYGVRASWTERHGFGISWSSVKEGQTRDFAGLQAEWLRRIGELRAGGDR